MVARDTARRTRCVDGGIAEGVCMTLPSTRSGALGVVAATTILLLLLWLSWRYVAEGTQTGAVHVFQYVLLTLLAAAVIGFVAPPATVPLLGIAAAATVAVRWVDGADDPRLVAAALAMLVVAASAYGLVRRSRTAGGLAVAALVVSLLGMLTIL